MPSGQKLLNTSPAKHEEHSIVDKMIRFFDFPGKNRMSYAAKHLELLSVSVLPFLRSLKLYLLSTYVG